MMDDVETAVQWIRSHNKCHARDRKIVFGGYSSGGHVAALTLPRLLSSFSSSSLSCKPSLDHESPFQAILYISPVLAVQGNSSSTWGTLITDTLMYWIWGPPWRHQVPSPLTRLAAATGITSTTPTHTLNTITTKKKNEALAPVLQLPHYIFMCQHEVPFGLDFVLEPFFQAGPLYHETLCRGSNRATPSSTFRLLGGGGGEEKKGRSASTSSSSYSVLLPVNHWTILASSELREAVREEWERGVQCGCGDNHDQGVESPTNGNTKSNHNTRHIILSA